MPSFFGLRIFTIKNDENVMSGEMTDTWVNMPRAYDTDKSIIWETRVGDRYYPDQNKRGRVPNKRGFSKNAGLNASEKMKCTGRDLPAVSVIRWIKTIDRAICAILTEYRV